MRRQFKRSESGQSLVIMIFVMAFLILGVVGMFSFEISRANLAREQLRSACQAASLAGAATLASSDLVDPKQAQLDAITSAMVVFKKNYVLGNVLNGATQSPDLASLSTNTTAKNCIVFFEFLDPNKNDAVVKIGDPNGKVIRVNSSFGLVPSFGKYLGLTTLPIEGIASAGVPQLDVVLCFDVSGSIDDQTPVTFVKRLWNGGTGKIDYKVTSARAGSPAGALAQGTIYSILGPPATGTGFNAN
ncbi:MAG: Tad domain-containing protein, partial [Candidatus Obscuribacterales bacterium]|nr:Tad domain-containing protein [Candidatus Obscuribacterales bacterium]